MLLDIFFFILYVLLEISIDILLGDFRFIFCLINDILTLNLCLKHDFFHFFNLFLFLANLPCKILHAIFVYFFSSLWQNLSCKEQSMEREFLKDERSFLQEAAKDLTEMFNFFHALYYLYTWLTDDFLYKFIWLKDFIIYLLYGNFHSIC